ncbi:hypothetical protein [Zoogloea sp.]|uniref:hypothetical protein n=1 Tax=Zoogloea sp. TaxID=49181 RepID=UPI0026079D77|nr:hypothetical protein [Zoogloea sp.]
MKHVLRIGLATALLALSGCSVVDTIRPATREGGIIERPAGSPASSPSGRLKPMPLRTFSLSTQCRFKDEAGNFGSATVDVVNSKVNAFKAELTMPKRGTCRFDLAQFRQTQALPSIELTGARDCRVHMWDQGEQVTVAFANCHHLCSPASAQDYVWPLLIDKATGQCD